MGMERVKEKGAKVRSFEGSNTARSKLGTVEPEVVKADLDVIEGKVEAPEAKPKVKAKKAEPKAAKEKQIRKAKFSVAIAPSDLELLRKAAKAAGKSVSLFAAECVMDRVR